MSAQVVLVSRHTFKKREFEVDSMYFGNKGLYAFRVCASTIRSLALPRANAVATVAKTKEPKKRCGAIENRSSSVLEAVSRVSGSPFTAPRPHPP